MLHVADSLPTSVLLRSCVLSLHYRTLVDLVHTAQYMAPQGVTIPSERQRLKHGMFTCFVTVYSLLMQ